MMLPLHEADESDIGDYFDDEMIKDLVHTGGYEADTPAYSNAATGERLFVGPSEQTLTKFFGSEKAGVAVRMQREDGESYLYVAGRKCAFLCEVEANGVWSFETFHGQTVTDFFGPESFLTTSLKAHYHKTLAEQLKEPEENEEYIKANIQLLLAVGGEAEVAPYEAWFEEFSTPAKIGLGIKQAQAGKLDSAAQLMGVPRATVFEDGLLWKFEKSEIASLFESRKYVENILEGDWYQYEGEYPARVQDIADDVPDSFYEAVKLKLVNRRIILSGDEHDEPTLLTKAILAKVTRQELEQWLINGSEYDPEDCLEDVKDAMLQGYRRACSMQHENAVYKDIFDEVHEHYGAKAHTYDENDRIEIKYVAWENLYDLWQASWRGVDSVDELFGDDRPDLTLNDNLDFDWTADEDYLDEAFSCDLDLIEKWPYPEVPGQQQLNLESLLQEGYDYATTQINLPVPMADFIIDWGRANVPDSAVYTDPHDDTLGREHEMHVTVLFGLTEPNGNRALHKLSEKYAPFPIMVGAVSLFKTNPKYDVIKLNVESPWLRKLHDDLKQSVPNEDKWPEYSPHVTIAYVKKGSCDKMEGTDLFAKADMDRVFTAYALEYKGPGDKDDANRVTDSILFTKPVPKATSAVEEALPFDSNPFPADASSLRKHLLKTRKAKGPKLIV